MNSGSVGFVEEARADIRQWWEEDSVAETLVKLVETIIGLGVVARAACHVAAHLAVTGRQEAYPDVDWRFSRALAVETDVSLLTELLMRGAAGVYGLVWALVVLPVSVSAGSPTADAVLRALLWVNVLVLVVDPIFLGYRD
jgi:hypothetical protein